ncbi:hypothetical protein [Nonomuraea aridisoli]|uniref:Uncharacterized protein n=1 Tax=Nonomuraea aridisoli TaxID=2070368 RepID=A0A2W2D991_9ACTN|nr:hypothetical protein [Nonomuraea aridisoli]PZG08572.1 hypothetical protein C1J01_38810 [Nonomuraea aridisoli]
MPRTIAAAIALAASVAVIPVAAQPAVAKPAAVQQAAAKKAAVKACYDGRCRLTLTKRVAFPVDPRFGITRLTVDFTADIVRVTGSGARAMSRTQIGKGGSGSVNGIGVRVESLSASKAVVVLTPKR